MFSLSFIYIFWFTLLHLHLWVPINAINPGNHGKSNKDYSVEISADGEIIRSDDGEVIGSNDEGNVNDSIGFVVENGG